VRGFNTGYFLNEFVLMGSKFGEKVMNWYFEGSKSYQDSEKNNRSVNE